MFNFITYYILPFFKNSKIVCISIFLFVFFAKCLFTFLLWVMYFFGARDQPSEVLVDEMQSLARFFIVKCWITIKLWQTNSSCGLTTTTRHTEIICQKLFCVNFYALQHQRNMKLNFFIFQKDICFNTSSTIYHNLKPSYQGRSYIGARRGHGPPRVSLIL